MINHSFPNRQPAQTLLDVLETREREMPDEVGFAYLRDNEDTLVTYREIAEKSRAVAVEVRRHAKPGDRAVLVYPPGLDFITGFLGCACAGVTAVPACYPKPRRPMPRLTTIASDAKPAVALSNSQTLETLELDKKIPALAGLQWIATDQVDAKQADQWDRPNLSGDDLAFLQYTSGSTSDPKGVMVTHGNLVHNLEMIRQGFGLPHSRNAGSAVFWLPAYHDMGLIGGILVPLYLGGRSSLMSPASFLQRPFRWLKAMSDNKATISGAPNFAYDLCARKIKPQQLEQLDLSNWQIIFCGAEPIRPETMERFVETFAPAGLREDAFYPCYGLAEATLYATGGDGPSTLTHRRFQRAALAEHRVVEAEGDEAYADLVGCGEARCGQNVRIVDPDTCCLKAPGEIGEVWIQGPSVAKGYWKRPVENEHTFGAYIADTKDGPYMRSGDLGFEVDGHLYIAGRLKDVIIIRGRNHYPQDIELSVETAHEALRARSGAAFSIEIDGEESLVVVHEMDRHFRDVDYSEVTRKIRQVISEDHELDVQRIVLIKHGKLPLTTSGKVQRNRCCKQYLAEELVVLHEWKRPAIQPMPSRGEAQEAPKGQKDGNGKANGNGRRKGHAGLEVTRVDLKQEGVSGSGVQFSRDIRETPATADEIDRLTERVETWLLEWLVARAGVDETEVDRQRPFAEYGLDSMTAVEMSQEIEDWLGVELTATVAWNYPTPAAMAKYLARRSLGVDEEVVVATETPADQEFESLLAEIEQLSDDEAEAAITNLRTPPSGGTETS